VSDLPKISDLPDEDEIAEEQALMDLALPPEKRKVRLWEPGESGNPNGRPPGPTKAQRAFQQFCLDIADSVAYRRSIAKRLIAGKLPPPIELMILDRALGKVPDRVEVGGAGEFDGMTVDEMRAKALDILERWHRAKAIEAHPALLDTSSTVPPEPQDVVVSPLPADRPSEIAKEKA
jgi:hypothetical protein